MSTNAEPNAPAGPGAIVWRVLAILTFAGVVAIAGTVGLILVRVPPNRAVVIAAAVCYGAGWGVAVVRLALDQPSESRDRWLGRVLFFNGSAAAAYLWSRGAGPSQS